MASKNLIKVGNPNLSQSPKTSLTRDVAATSGTTLNVMSTTGFSSIATTEDNYYVLIGTYGSENAEIVLVSAKTDTTFTISAPKFSHSASDQVVFIPYNQVKIYGKVLSGDTPVLLSTVDIDSSQQYTSYDYTPTAPVYVFFVTSYYNSHKTEESSKSDEISLGVFTVNSVKKIIESGLRKAMTKVDENPNGLLSWSILIDLVNEGIAEILTRKKKWQCLHKRITGDNTIADVEYIEKPDDLSVLEFLLVNGIKLDYITKYQYNQITQNGVNITSGIPSKYTIKNDMIYMVPKPNGAYETIFEYYSTHDVIESLTQEVKKELATILVYFIAAQASYIRNNEKRGNLMEAKYTRVLENQIEDVTGEEQAGDAVQTERFNYFDIE